MSYINDILSLFGTVYHLLVTAPIVVISAVVGALLYHYFLIKNPALLKALATKAEAALKSLEP